MDRVIVLMCLLVVVSAGCVRWRAPAMTPATATSCRTGALRWFSPDDARERLRLDSWCAAVGPPVVADVRTASGQHVALDELTFVSWNVHVGSGDIRAFVSDLRTGVHTQGRVLTHFVVLVQEAVRTTEVPGLANGAAAAGRIGSPEPSADIERVARDLGLALLYVPSMRNGRRTEDPAVDRGSAILSSLPLTDGMAVELPGERQRRVAIVARAGPVWVGTVHLDALGSPRRLWALWTPWMREFQLSAVKSLLPDGPLVLGADLNTWHGVDESAARMLDALPGITPVSKRPSLHLRTLDYMFFRVGTGRSAQYTRIERSYGSDHRPLIGWID